MNKIEKVIKIRKISLVCLFLSIPLCFIGCFFPFVLFTIIGISLLPIFIVFSILFWKCPYCNYRLPMKFDKDSDIDSVYQCPHCNKKFN
jgi:DNA-directed RNA polymerase subunit RPC12/RpoP